MRIDITRRLEKRASYRNIEVHCRFLQFSPMTYEHLSKIIIIKRERDKDLRLTIGMKAADG
jgi:hypothetical protein